MELAADTAIFTDYLRQFGLPTSNVIANSGERAVVGSNLPAFLDALSKEAKVDARYLSKFVGAAAIGLFDAALNYIWNEVVLNLRKKVVIYGIELFYDAAVGGANRASFKDDSDLDGLKDSVLLDTCQKLELVSDVVYRKLDHILTMRNEVAASHPNVESIGGYELLGWLQTCVRDVLQDRPSDSSIRIKALVENIRASTTVIDSPTAERFQAELRNLSLPHAKNLLVTLFGIFVDPASDQILRANVARIAPSVWGHADDSVRFKIGSRIDGYRTNLQQDRLAKGIEFLTIVDGRMYETLPTRTIALDGLADRLDDAHDGRDNFYSEPPVMREVLMYCRTSRDLPASVLPKLTSAVLRCRIGRGLSYRDGVSPAGKPLYDRFLGMLDDAGIALIVEAMFRPEINGKLASPICQRHLQEVLQIIRPLAISERLRGVTDFLLADIPSAHRASSMPAFRDLCRGVITLS